MEQADEINRIAGKLDGVEDKLRDLLNNSRHSIDNSQAALDLIKRGEGKKAQIQVWRTSMLPFLRPSCSSVDWKEATARAFHDARRLHKPLTCVLITE